MLINYFGQNSTFDDYGCFIRFRQKENQGSETLPISDQARDLLGPIDEPTERVSKD
jgi:hypothetical protein